MELCYFRALLNIHVILFVVHCWIFELLLAHCWVFDLCGTLLKNWSVVVQCGLFEFVVKYSGNFNFKQFWLYKIVANNLLGVNLSKFSDITIVCDIDIVYSSWSDSSTINFEYFRSLGLVTVILKFSWRFEILYQFCYLNCR